MHSSLRIDGHTIEGIVLRGGQFPEDWAEQRRHLPAWGTLVEIPAVLELLDLVAAGHLDASLARWFMARMGESVIRTVDPHGCGTKGCVEGNHCRGEFKEERLEELLRRERVASYLAARPAPPQQPVSHPCQPCGDCSACSCYDGAPGRCQKCRWIRSARTRARQDVSRWNDGVAAGCTYAVTERRLHRWNCPTLGSADERLAAFEELLEETGGRVDWTRLPTLHTPDELRRTGNQTRRCATCGPDPL
ncbi:hypothetical protein ACFYNO_32695 [Kitasatospora sp. NPDC006697]|uniref:hypothetical protein n=1 Tax=Kitasatospora sp. NPDC006697 TaxID=3364020 RepID=UPI0036B52BAC